MKKMAACAIVLLFGLFLAGCSRSEATGKRLVFVSPDSQTAASSDLSSVKSDFRNISAEQAEGTKTGNREPGTTEAIPSSGDKERKTSSGKTKDSDGQKAEPPVTDELSVDDAVSIYNAAAQKNAALPSLSFNFTNHYMGTSTTGSFLLNGKSQFYKKIQTDMPGGSVIQEFYCESGVLFQNYRLAGSENYSVHSGAYNADNYLQYSMILNPGVNVDDVDSFSAEKVGENWVLHFKVNNFDDYNGIYQIIGNDKGGKISGVNLCYTISEPGYIVASSQQFELSSASFQMDKQYNSPGSQVNIVRPDFAR